MTYNKIQVAFGALKKITGPSLQWQYNEKQILVITGLDLPEYYAVDFCNEGDADTITMTASAAGVEIPDQFLLTGKKLIAYIVVVDGEAVNTVGQITFPVNVRGRRTDISPEPAEQQQIDSLIAALNSGVGRAEAAAEAIQDMDVEAETLAAGSAASVEKTVDPETGAVTLNFGIPQGQKGGPGGDSGTSDYAELENKPQINGHTLDGNQSAADLGLGTYSKPADGIPKTDLAQDVQMSLGKANTALQTAPVQSVAGKTGTVTLGAEDIGFNSSEEYNEGTVGAELSELNRQLSDVEENQIPELKNAISQLQPTATASDVGKALIVKTVDTQTGKPTSYKYGDGSGGAVDDVQINGTSIVSSGVANIPVGTGASPGVVRALEAYGMAITNDGLIHIVGANQTAQFKALNALYTPVTLSTATTVLFYALAKLAGDATLSASDNPVGTYTEGAKSAIHGMLNGAVTVSGTTPTIAAKDGITYVCGEVATLDFTPSATGICDVVFTSGATATVLTVPSTIKWANGFDPTSLEANTTYEINIMDGIGVAVGVSA